MQARQQDDIWYGRGTWDTRCKSVDVSNFHLRQAAAVIAVLSVRHDHYHSDYQIKQLGGGRERQRNGDGVEEEGRQVHREVVETLLYAFIYLMFMEAQ